MLWLKQRLGVAWDGNVDLNRILDYLPQRKGEKPEQMLEHLMPLLDTQQQVHEAGELVASYLSEGGDDRRLLARLGKALLREDRDFHSIQALEAAVSEYELLWGTPEAVHVLIAAAR